MRAAALLCAVSVVACGRPIGDAANRAPVAVAGGDRSATVDEVLRFDASASTDEDGSVADARWDFGDGSVEAHGLVVNHAWSAAGGYVVTLTVTDDAGAEGTAQLVVTVAPPQPVARIAFSPTAPRALSVVEFDSSLSSGPAAIATAQWIFGDGAAATGTAVEHTYAAAGEYTVTLVVTDSDGTEASADVAVSVAAPDVEGTYDVNANPERFDCGTWDAIFPDAALTVALGGAGAVTLTGADGRAYDGTLDADGLDVADTVLLDSGGGCPQAAVDVHITGFFGDGALYGTATAYYDAAVGCQCSAAFTLTGTRR